MNALDITPDQVDYVIGQIFGGPGREIVNAMKGVESIGSGELPQVRNIPVIGRLGGTTKGVNSESEPFYKNLREINIAENEYKGVMQNGGNLADVYKEYGYKLDLVKQAKAANRNVKKLREELEEVRKRQPEGYRDTVKELQTKIQEEMRELNQKMDYAKQKEAQAVDN